MTILVQSSGGWLLNVAKDMSYDRMCENSVNFNLSMDRVCGGKLRL